MAISQKTSSVNVKIIPALQEHEPILANLFELYAHDFSEFIDLKLGADGRFGYKYLPLYWKESNHHPFLIMVNDNLAGFVFVRRGSEISNAADVWDIAEFFIVRGYRRLGVGIKVAHKIWKQFLGKWEVRVIDRNQKAKEFWERAIDEFLGRTINPTPFLKNGEGWHVFSFESKHDA
jgi:predicted acetyltransferase